MLTRIEYELVYMTMVTEPILFEVMETPLSVSVPSTLDSSIESPQSVDGRWFKKINEGERQGIEYPLPLKHPAYNSSLQDRLCAVTTGDRLWVRMTPENEQGTKWRVYEVVEDRDIPEKV